MILLLGPFILASETNQVLSPPSGERKDVARIFTFPEAKLFGVVEGDRIILEEKTRGLSRRAHRGPSLKTENTGSRREYRCICVTATSENRAKRASRTEVIRLTTELSVPQMAFAS